eukprot:916651-Prorocentrum_minimum.AAC.5
MLGCGGAGAGAHSLSASEVQCNGLRPKYASSIFGFESRSLLGFVQVEGRTLVFVQKKRTATWLKKQLQRGGPEDGGPGERFTPVAAQDIHGDRSQASPPNTLGIQ